MKISYDEINNRNDPYQLFLDNIKSPHTARKYKKSLEVFLRSIPDEIYEKSRKQNPSVKILVNAFELFSGSCTYGFIILYVIPGIYAVVRVIPYVVKFINWIDEIR